MSDLSGIYNFVTGEFYDRLPATDEEAMQCLPGETARQLYDLYRRRGDPLLAAYELTLKAIAEAHEAVHGESHADPRP